MARVDSAIVVALFLTVAVPQVRAAPEETVTGSIQFDQAILGGQTNLTASDWKAVHLYADEKSPLKETWVVEAKHAVVNWTRVDRKGVGTSPTDPSGSLFTTGPSANWGNDPFSSASLTTTVLGSQANFLILPDNANAFVLSSAPSSALTTVPSKGEKWTGGVTSNATTDTSNEAWRNVRETYSTLAGQPIFQTSDGFSGTVRGNLTIFVWGADVTVRDPASQARTYRSGSWFDNATGPGPRGTARDEHWQFLRLRLTDAVVGLSHDGGSAQWTAPEMETRTDGTVSYTRARGTLESDRFLYAPQDESFQIRGNVAQRVESSSDSQLRGAVEAERAAVTLAGTTIPRTPGSEYLGIVWWVLAILGAAALVSGAVWGWPRVRSRMDWSLQLTLAEEEFEKRRFDKSDRRLARLLRRRIPLAEARADAWFLRSAGRMELGDSAWLLREAAPRMEELGNPPMLAYLLTLASVEHEDMDSARKWGQIVRNDPLIMERFLQDERIQKHRRRLGFMWERPFDPTGYS